MKRTSVGKDAGSAKKAKSGGEAAQFPRGGGSSLAPIEFKVGIPCGIVSKHDALRTMFAPCIEASAQG